MITGTRIIDLSRIIVGPYASMVLSDFGCEVIKVESPQGDPTREWGPPWVEDTSAYFLSINRNKKSISLDFKKKTHLNILYKLVEKADAVVENFVPGTTERLSIDYETLKKYNEKLVYCSISGYGDIGSLKNTPCFDNAIQAEAGFMHLTGDAESQPYKLGFAITDVITGLYASNALLAGLLRRQRTGKGIHLKTSLYQCAVAALINQSSNYLNGNMNPKRIGNHHPNIVPYGLYQTKDTSIIVCVGTQKQYERMISVLKMPVVEKFSTNGGRVTHREQFNQALNGCLKDYDSNEVIQIFRQNNIPCAKVNSIKDTLESELARELGVVQKVDNLKFVRSPIRTNVQGTIEKPVRPPKINQHASQLLREIGYSSSEIAQFISSIDENKD